MQKQVYLKRVAASAGNPRQMLGGDRVESLLADFGFVAVDPAALSFVEQVMLLQNADCIVAPVGAALANLVFAPPGRKVIALAPYYRDADYYYFANLLGILGHKLYYIVGPNWISRAFTACTAITWSICKRSSKPCSSSSIKFRRVNSVFKRVGTRCQQRYAGIITASEYAPWRSPHPIWRYPTACVHQAQQASRRVCQCRDRARASSARDRPIPRAARH